MISRVRCARNDGGTQKETQSFASLRHIIEQIQLILTEIQFGRHTILVMRDKPLDVFLNQLYGRGFSRLAVVFERFILPLRQLERYRMVLVTSSMTTIFQS